jgi:uncharacterized membrane protein
VRWWNRLWLGWASARELGRLFFDKHRRLVVASISIAALDKVARFLAFMLPIKALLLLSGSGFHLDWRGPFPVTNVTIGAFLVAFSLFLYLIHHLAKDYISSRIDELYRLAGSSEQAEYSLTGVRAVDVSLVISSYANALLLGLYSLASLAVSPVIFVAMAGLVPAFLQMRGEDEDPTLERRTSKIIDVLGFTAQFIVIATIALFLLYFESLSIYEAIFLFILSRQFWSSFGGLIATLEKSRNAVSRIRGRVLAAGSSEAEHQAIRRLRLELRGCLEVIGDLFGHLDRGKYDLIDKRQQGGYTVVLEQPSNWVIVHSYDHANDQFAASEYRALDFLKENVGYEYSSRLLERDRTTYVVTEVRDLAMPDRKARLDLIWNYVSELAKIEGVSAGKQLGLSKTNLFVEFRLVDFESLAGELGNNTHLHALRWFLDNYPALEQQLAEFPHVLNNLDVKTANLCVVPTKHGTAPHNMRNSRLELSPFGSTLYKLNNQAFDNVSTVQQFSTNCGVHASKRDIELAMFSEKMRFGLRRNDISSFLSDLDLLHKSMTRVEPTAVATLR